MQATSLYRYLLFIIMAVMQFPAQAQETGFDIQTIYLPPELSYFDNQFSSLNLHKKQIFLMPECRVMEMQESKLYCIPLKELKRHMADTAYHFTYQKIPIIGLETLAGKMLAQGQEYEGLEGMIIRGKDVYLSVETTTASDYAYLLKGRLLKDKVVLDTNQLLPVYKPLDGNGNAIYNAGFECMEWFKGRIYIFYEFNYFQGKNFVYSYNSRLDPASKDSVQIDRMPFRISDLKATGNDHFVAINSFYNGSGRDTINRPLMADTINYNLVHDTGGFHNYGRLVAIHFNGEKFTWKPLFVMPKKYEGFNWEGIAVYKKGFFIVNDKYTATKPYYSTMLYLKPKQL